MRPRRRLSGITRGDSSLSGRDCFVSGLTRRITPSSTRRNKAKTKPPVYLSSSAATLFSRRTPAVASFGLAFAVAPTTRSSPVHVPVLADDPVHGPRRSVACSVRKFRKEPVWSPAPAWRRPAPTAVPWRKRVMQLPYFRPTFRRAPTRATSSSESRRMGAGRGSRCA